MRPTFVASVLSLLVLSSTARAELRLVEALRLEVPASSLVPVDATNALDGGPLPALFSAMMPGVGQFTKGEVIKGFGFLGGFAVTSIVGLGLATVGPDEKPGPSNWFGLGLLGVSALLYGWSIIDAWTYSGSGGDAPVLRPGELL